MMSTPFDVNEELDLFVANVQTGLLKAAKPGQALQVGLADVTTRWIDVVMTKSGTTCTVDILRANADLFGIDPAALDRLHGGEPSLLVVDTAGGATLGEINVQHFVQANHSPLLDITVLFWVAATPTHPEEEVAQRVIGRSYSATFGFAKPPMRDCAMTSRSAAGCKTRVEHTRQRELKLGPTDVRTVTWLAPDGDKIRVVTCVDAGPLSDPQVDSSWQGLAPSMLTLSPRGTAPRLPLLADAVTGELVELRIRDCYDPIFTSIRDEE